MDIAIMIAVAGLIVAIVIGIIYVRQRHIQIGLTRRQVEASEEAIGRPLRPEEAPHVSVGDRLRCIPVTAPKPLIGRDAMLETIRERLAENKPVLLYGLGGMGKTALADILAEEAFADRDRYPDGVLWSDVRGQSLEDLCDEVFRDEGDTEAVRQSADLKPGMVRARLGNERLLIVLDDVDEKNDAARTWCREAQPPDTPLIVTSRQELVGFGDGVLVEELGREDAKALLRYHIGGAAERLSDEAADAICEALGDHPLALQLMGEVIKEYHRGKPDDALEELGPAHERLRKLRIKTGETKDESVYVSLELSWRRLNDDRRLVSGRLAACFAPDTGSELLGLICGLRRRFKPALNALDGLSLVRERGGRWGAHALVRDFVRAVVGEDGWEVAQRAVVEGCVTYAYTYNGKERADHDRLEAERVNLLEAVGWAAKQGMHEAVNCLAWDLVGNSEFMITRGYAREAVGLLEAGAAAARALGERRDEGVHLGNLGVAYHALGQVERAIGYYEQALAIHREISDRRGEGSYLGNLGLAYAALGQVERAIEYHKQARAIHREIGDRRGEGNQLGNLGSAYYVLGQVERAIEHYEQALAIRREIGDRRGEGNDLGNLGVAYHALGQVERTIGYYEQALAIRREIGDRRGEGNDLGNLGLAYAALGQVEQAIEHHEQALAISREVKDKRGEGNQLSNLGLAYAELGRVDEAIEYYEQALAISQEVKDKRGERDHLSNLGIFYKNLGQVNKAIEYYERALSIAREIGDRHGEGKVLGGLANVCYEQGRVKQAIRYLKQALAATRETDDRQGEGQVLDGLANVCYKQGQVKQAIRYLKQALAATRETGNRSGEGHVLFNLGVAYGELGQMEQAIEHFEQALAIARETGNRHGEGHVLSGLGNAYAVLGQVERAIEFYERALAISREIGDRSGEGRHLFNMGLLFGKQGRIDEAIEHIEEARAIFAAIKSPDVGRCDEALKQLRGR